MLFALTFYAQYFKSWLLDVHGWLFLFQSLKDNLAIAYMKLSDFKSPLYLAFSYEKKQKPKHVQLAAIIKGTSYYVNGSISILRSLVRENLKT